MLGLKPVQKTLEVDWASETVGITTVAASTLLMVLGSLFFPDHVNKEPGSETGKEEMTA